MRFGRSEETYGPYTVEQMAAALDRLWDEIGGDVLGSETASMSRAAVVDVTIDQAHQQPDRNGAIRQFVEVCRHDFPTTMFGYEITPKMARAFKKVRNEVVLTAFPKHIKRYCY